MCIKRNQGRLARVAWTIWFATKAATETTIDVSTAIELSGVVGRDRIHGHTRQVPTQARAHATGLQALAVVTVRGVVACVKAIYDVVGTAFDDVRAKGGGCTREITTMHVKEAAKAAIGIGSLQSHSLVVVPFKIRGGIRQRVMYAVVSALGEHGGAHSPIAADRGVDCSLHIDGTVVTDTDRGIAF